MIPVTQPQTRFLNSPLPADAFSEIRRQAFETFERLGFPTTRHEEWKYTNIQPLLKQDFNSVPFREMSAKELLEYEIPDLDAEAVVLLNGHFQPQLSRLSEDSGLQVVSLKAALASNAELLNTHFAKYAGFQGNAMVALNTALAQEGVVIRILKNKIVHKPLVIYHLSEAETPAFTQLRNLILFEENAQATVIQVYKGKNQALSLTNAVTEIVVSENAVAHHFNIQQEDRNGCHIGTTEVYQSKSSVFTDLTATLGGRLIRNNLNIVLDAENCEANMMGLYLLNGMQLVDNHTLADHRKPNSVSNELYKGTLDGQSTGVFNGKIFVRQDAQKTNAYQSNRSLVLSPEAAMNTKPQLEIFADDVKCTHGAAVGQLDENLLFYLQARGIPRQQAKSLLMVAFAGEVLDKVKPEVLKTYLQSAIEDKLAR